MSHVYHMRSEMGGPGEAGKARKNRPSPEAGNSAENLVVREAARSKTSNSRDEFDAGVHDIDDEAEAMAAAEELVKSRTKKAATVDEAAMEAPRPRMTRQAMDAARTAYHPIVNKLDDMDRGTTHMEDAGVYDPENEDLAILEGQKFAGPIPLAERSSMDLDLRSRPMLREAARERQASESWLGVMNRGAKKIAMAAEGVMRAVFPKIEERPSLLQEVKMDKKAEPKAEPLPHDFKGTLQDVGAGLLEILKFTGSGVVDYFTDYNRLNPIAEAYEQEVKLIAQESLERQALEAAAERLRVAQAEAAEIAKRAEEAHEAMVARALQAREALEAKIDELEDEHVRRSELLKATKNQKLRADVKADMARVEQQIREFEAAAKMVEQLSRMAPDTRQESAAA